MDRSSAAARLFGVVFAGGRSDRMGRDKALLAWPGADGVSTTLFERAARTLALLCERVEVAVGSEGRLQSDAWPTFPDGVPGAGPLAGLLAALERAQGLGAGVVLVLACDMPRVGLGELRALLDALESGPADEPAADVALWVVDGRDQPLCAAYRTACAVPARAAFESGERRVVGLFDGAMHAGGRPHVKRLIADKNSARRLVNVNTKSDYDRVLQEALDPTGHPETAPGTCREPSPHDR